MNNYQKFKKLVLSNPLKLGKFWHVCEKCNNKQFTKKFTRNCKKCGNKNTVFYVGLDGLVYPESQNHINVVKN